MLTFFRPKHPREYQEFDNVDRRFVRHYWNDQLQTVSPPIADHFSQQTFDSLQAEVSLRKQLQADMLTRDHLYKKE